MALTISDLPRENSATKATMSLLERTLLSRRWRRSCTAAPCSALSFNQREKRRSKKENSRRQAPCSAHWALNVAANLLPLRRASIAIQFVYYF